MYKKSHEETDWFDKIWNHQVSFFLVFMTVAFITYSVLYYLDFIPEPYAVEVRPNPGVAMQLVSTTTVNVKTPAPAVDDETPDAIIIEKFDRREDVLNPEKSDIASLNAALLSGVVRYPLSADFNNVGTMVLLGHSSYLPTVHNKNFQAFNGVQKLTWGDIIRLESGNAEYVYRVQRVYEAKASTAEVPLQWKKPELILITCNSFGSKEDRFIVEAYLISTNPLVS